MNKLVSKNLSTQFDKQLASPLENEVDGVPVIHLECRIIKPSGRVDGYCHVLVPAHACELVDG